MISVTGIFVYITLICLVLVERHCVDTYFDKLRLTDVCKTDLVQKVFRDDVIVTLALLFARAKGVTLVTNHL